MKYRRIGSSGLKVSEISLGSWMTFGGYVAKEQSIKTIQRAYDLGINFFDTANMYGRGEAEKVVGEALRSYPRESVVVGTKVWGEMGPGPNDRGLSRKHIMEQADASLRRLGLEYIDIYYCHRYVTDTPLEETLRAMNDLIRSGKVLYLGVSEWTAAQITDACALADKYLLDRIIVNQPYYNMLGRSIEREIIPVCREKGIGQVVFSPLAEGVLTGKYRKGQGYPAGSRGTSIGWHDTKLKDTHLEKAELLLPIADELGIPLAQLALAWILRLPEISSALVGSTKPEQIKMNAGASDIVLPEEIIEKIEQIVG